MREAILNKVTGFTADPHFRILGMRAPESLFCKSPWTGLLVILHI